MTPDCLPAEIMTAAEVARYLHCSKAHVYNAINGKMTLGRLKEMTKTRAKNELAAIVQPINSREKTLSRTSTFGEFIRDCYRRPLARRVRRYEYVRRPGRR